MRRFALWTAVALALVSGAFAPASEAAEDAGTDILTDDDRALLAWFDGLGFPVPEGSRFGAVQEDWSLPTDGASDEHGRKVVAWGFLLREDEATFVVRTTALEERTYERSAGRTRRVTATFEPRDLLDELRRAVDVPGEHGFVAPFTIRSWLSGAADLAESSLWVVGASIAARRGETALAHRLLERGHTETARRRNERAPPDLRGRVAANLAVTAIWRAKLALDRPDTKREDLLVAFRRVEEKFPGTEHADEAARYAKVLERMVAEDHEHAKAARSLDSLSPAGRAEEWIFQLRDQDGGQFMQPGGPTIFADARGKESPAERLLALGTLAVPHLLAHFEDDGFTRTIGFWRDFSYSHYAVTIGEACAAIVSRIANRRIDVLWGERWSPARARAARTEAEAWWAEHQKGGERATNLSALRAGGRDARTALRRLCEIDPELAIVEGLAAIERASGRDRHGLVQEVVKLADDARVLAFLVRTAESDTDRSCRVYAATTLLDRGHASALELALPLWRSVNVVGGHETDWDDEILSRALLEFGGAAGAKVVLDWFESAGPRSRQWFLQVGTRWSPLVPQDPGARVRVADLLAPLLDDTTDTGTTWTTRDRTGGERVADLAATWIAPLLADGAKFDAHRTEAERDVDISRLRASWRTARGLGPVPQEPDLFPPVAAADAAAIAQVVARVAGGDEGAAAELERIGLAALPAVRARIPSERDDAAVARLRATESRLTRIVRTVVIEPKDAAPPSLAAALDEFEGHVLDGDRVVALARLVAAVHATVQERSLPEIRVERPREADGLVVRVSLLRGDPPGRGLDLEISRVADGERERFTHGSEEALTDDQLTSLRKLWAPCEAARRDREIQFRVRFVR